METGLVRDRHSTANYDIVDVFVKDKMLLTLVITILLLPITWNLNLAGGYISCDLEVEVDVNKHIFYDGDKLVIRGKAALGTQLEGLLIPLDGEKSGKTVNIPLKRSNFEYTLHHFESDDKAINYAVIVHGLKETDNGICLAGDYEIVEYKGLQR